MIWFGAVLVAATVDWIAVARGDKRLGYIFKPATIVLLGVAACANAGAVRAEIVFPALVAALVFSLAGDVFLMLPQDRFVPGLSAFLLAHLAYIAVFAPQADLTPAWAAAASIVVLAGAVIGSRIVGGLRSSDRRSFIGPVLAYMVVITAMVLTVLATRNAWAIGGALLFFISDATIGWTRFVRSHPGGPLAIIVTYHLGQLGLVIGALRPS